MEKMTEREKEYLPLLKYVMILSEKGVPTTVESVANMMAIGAIDTKREDGQWYVAKAEMLKRIKARGKKWPSVESGYYSIYGLLYQLSKRGIDLEEGNISNFMLYGELEFKQDMYGRHLFQAHELEKLIKKYSSRR
jgi:hypothetical protein